MVKINGKRAYFKKSSKKDGDQPNVQYPAQELVHANLNTRTKGLLRRSTKILDNISQVKVKGSRLIYYILYIDFQHSPPSRCTSAFGLGTRVPVIQTRIPDAYVNNQKTYALYLYN